jgi:diguanylate cyclase (GGDEF)-like protein
LSSSIIAGLLLLGYSFQQALFGRSLHQLPLGYFGAVLACMSIYCFLRLFATIETHVRRLRDRAVVDAGNWAFEYPYIRRRLREEQSKLDREGGHSALLLIEVPILGDLQETEEEERAARRVSQLLYDNLRGSDVTARIAVGLFLALLPDTTPEEGRSAAIRVWEASSDLKLDVEGEDDVRFTLLVGIAGYPDNGEDIDCTFAAAHEALNRAADQETSSIAVSKRKFRSIEKGDSIMRRVRGEGSPPSSNDA